MKSRTRTCAPYLSKPTGMLETTSTR